MKILLKSSDARALDSAVKQILAVEKSAVPLVLPSLVDKLPNGSILSHVSRRLVRLWNVDDEVMRKFRGMVFSSDVEVSIS